MEREFSENSLFQWHDYVLFCLMLIISTAIGLYYGYFKKNSTSINEYFLGGKDMNVFPIGMSITGSAISAVAMTAYPSEVYTYSIVYGLYIIQVPLVIVFINYAIIPVLYNLQLSSIYEYMELRFNKKLRIIISFLYTFNMLTILPVIIYLSSASLQQGTGFNIHYFSLIQCLVCTFYTTIGGLKTVVWTDTLQFGLMIGSSLVVAIIGTLENGGILQILQVAKEGNRFDIIVDADLTLRDSIWTVIFGNTFFWMQSLAINQAYIQKCFALPTMKHVTKALMLFAISVMFLFTFIVFSALIMYSVFKGCDPLSAGKIMFQDQLMAYYILQISEKFPGIAGLFIAGVTSAALSSLSAGMNALSCTIYKDFINPFLPDNFSEKNKTLVIKSIAGLVGVVSMLLLIVINKLGSAFQIIIGLGGITSGPMFGLFVLGMFTTRANSKGAIVGIFAAIAIMTFIVFGSLYYKMNKFIVYETMPMSTENCSFPHNRTISAKTIRNSDTHIPYIFRISHNYFITMGFALVLIIGLLVSLFTKPQKYAKKELLSPLIHWTLEEKHYAPVQTQETIKTTEFN